jgi:Tol biopolymer transport system component
MALTSGTRLGSYEITSAIGAGGMGEVYQAHDTKLGRDVAIKVLPEAFAYDAERLSRFQREAKMLASLNHPNIATIHGLEQFGGTSYLVMELLSGETLAERVKREGAVPVEEALTIAKQIAEALEAAHEKSIIHRDLKPANVKLTLEGKVKVLDFGLAKAFAGDELGSDPSNSPTLSQAATMQGVILGTAAYMSPEQARGKSVDKRTDIWAFGCVLYELLTGKVAFHSEDVTDILAAVVRAEPDWTALPKKVPSAIRILLSRCLRKDRRQRISDATDVRIEIEDAIAAPKDSGATQAAPTSMSKLRLAFGAVAAALAMIAVVTSWGWWKSTQPVEQVLRPLMRLDVNLGPDAVATADSSVAISPDGTRIIFPIRGADGKQLLATRPLDQAAITPLPGTENGSNAFFSRDGQWIGFMADRKLKKVSIRGGTPVTLTDVSTFRGASWGENGDIMASLLTLGGLQSVPASGGPPHSVTNLGKGEITHLSPQVLPGGNTVLFTASKLASSFEDANIEVVSLKTGAVKMLLSGGYFGRYLATNGSTGHLVYIHQGVLYAVAFDPVRLEVQGMPEPILEDVAGAAAFDFSRNGTFVYHPGIVADQRWPVVWLDGSGKTEPLVTTPGIYSWPRFSPDGKRLALVVDTGKSQEIFVYDRQRDALSRLTFAGGVNLSPIWSRDGEHFVFYSRNEAGSLLNWIRADGSGEIQVLLESKSRLTPSGFSPDGRRLAYYEIKPNGDVDLWTLPLDTNEPEHPKPGKPVPFLQTPAVEAWLVFSPDGRYVAYFSNESGTYEIYVRPAPGPDGKPGPGKWQISTGGGVWPEWSPNGRELFYKGLDNRIMVTDYTATGGSFSSNKPRVWSDRQIRPVGSSLNFALTPDGKRFAVFPMPEATAEGKGPDHVIFLLNFFDEVRRRTATQAK